MTDLVIFLHNIKKLFTFLDLFCAKIYYFVTQYNKMFLVEHLRLKLKFIAKIPETIDTKNSFWILWLF